MSGKIRVGRHASLKVYIMSSVELAPLDYSALFVFLSLIEIFHLIVQ
jgi:hypothetical protein